MVKYSQSLDRTFGALADPTRRAVLEQLATGPATLSELSDGHDITLAGMLKHVRVLESADLIRSVKQGRTRIVELKPRSFDPAARFVESCRNRWHRRFDSLADYLAENA